MSFSPVLYLELYRTQRERLMKNKPPASVWQYEYTVFTTWEISFATIEKECRMLQAYYGYADICKLKTYRIACLHSRIEPMVPEE